MLRAPAPYSSLFLLNSLWEKLLHWFPIFIVWKSFVSSPILPAKVPTWVCIDTSWPTFSFLSPSTPALDSEGDSRIEDKGFLCTWPEALHLPTHHQSHPYLTLVHTVQAGILVFSHCALELGRPPWLQALLAAPWAQSSLWQRKKLKLILPH